jgi:hypothetical protein
LGRETGLNRHQ